MDLKTLERQPGDLNLHTLNFLESQSFRQTKNLSESSGTPKTQSLSMISENTDVIEINDLIAFYDKLDRNLFDDKLTQEFVISEKDSYTDIQEIKNQNLYLAQSKATYIIAGILVKPSKKMALKLQRFYYYEHALRQLEEFRIHNKINNLFHDQSLQLITPVEIRKQKQIFEIVACTERGQSNLYDYSRVIPITQEQAFSIFKQIIIQIANLHSIDIAHRDVKPQNIFYVKNKGWLLSDFGESQEYDKVESTYCVRGTLYFLMPQVKQNISKCKLIEQNLLANDLYALVVTIIVIQSQNYILDIQREIKNLLDPLFLQCLHIRSYQELDFYIQKINQNDVPFQWEEKYNIYHQPQRYKCTEALFVYSLIGIQNHHKLFKLQTSCQKQLLQLIQEKSKEPLTEISPFQFRLLDQFKFINSRMDQFFKLQPLCLSSISWQEVALDYQLSRGYIEKPIRFSQEFLKQQYNQNIHLLLIKGLIRAEQFREADIQLELFNSGLKFDHLDNDLQYDYIGIKESKINTQQMFDLFNERLLTMLSCVDKVNFVVDVRQTQKITMFNKITCDYLNLLEIELLKYPIHIAEHILLNIFKMNFVENFITRSKQAGELGLIYILQNNSNKLYENYERLKQLLFNSESDFQAIVFNTQIIQLQLFEQQCTKKLSSQQINQKIKYVKDSIIKLQNCKLKIYIRHTIINLLSLIHNVFCFQEYLSPSLIYIIEYTLESIYKYEMIFYESSYYHQFTFDIYMRLRNYKRCRRLVLKYEQILPFQLKADYLSKLFKHQNYQPFSIYLSSEEQIIQLRKQQFIKLQYLLR